MKYLKSLIAISVLGWLPHLSQAQKAPQWIEYSYRASLYPETKYLVGFYSETGVTDFTDQVNSRISSVAKKTLIESIQVNLQSVTTSRIENINSETQEYFQNSSTSIARADIVGLKYETFYHPKKKEAFALAYAVKVDVIRYYHEILDKKVRLVETKLSEAASFESSGDRENTLKSYFECMPVFHEIEEAQSILVALEKVTVGLKIEQVNQAKLQVKQGISGLLSSKNLSLDEVGYFMAFGMKIQLESASPAVAVSKITYQDTDFTSAFSSRFAEVLSQNLTTVAKYQMAKNLTGNYYVEGSYWEEDDLLKVILNLYSPGASSRVVASVESYVPIAHLQSKGIEYLPEQLKKIKQLNEIILKPDLSKISIKTGQEAKHPLTILATQSSQPVPDLPIIYKFGQDGILFGSDKTTRDGKAKCVARNMDLKRKVQIVIAEVDVPTWTGLDRSSAYYQKVLRENTIPSTRIILTVSRPSVYVEANEKSLGQPMDIPFIEPTLKDALTELGYEFTDDLTSADLMVNIKANSRQGSEAYSIFFSYADATISITDMQTGAEVYKTVIKDLKGGGANYSQASIKSLKKIADQVKNEVLSQLTE